jgi:DtxR family Mn-dependent transcriptional regulator
MLSRSEENYLKTIYNLSDDGSRSVSTSELALRMNAKPASITDMMKKLSAKKLIDYAPYYGANITQQGTSDALEIIRKHRLWETFLVEKLGFQWDEVHEVAEQLEHVHSRSLVDKLDQFLGYPTADPHGQSIPDKNGHLKELKILALSEIRDDKSWNIRSIRSGSPALLQYLTKVGIYIGAKIQILERRPFDGSLEVTIDAKHMVTISREVSENIFVG